MRNLILLFTVASTAAFAGTVTVPEIDPTTATAALTLLSGGVLVLRSRRSKK